MHGAVDEAMYERFQQQLLFAPVDSQMICANRQARETLVLGKATVFSAGATFMAAFPATYRFLTRGTRPMFHERQMMSMVEL